MPPLLLLSAAAAVDVVVVDSNRRKQKPATPHWAQRTPGGRAWIRLQHMRGAAAATFLRLSHHHQRRAFRRPAAGTGAIFYASASAGRIDSLEAIIWLRPPPTAPLTAPAKATRRQLGQNKQTSSRMNNSHHCLII